MNFFTCGEEISRFRAVKSIAHPNQQQLKYLSKYFQKLLPQNCSLKNIFQKIPLKNCSLKNTFSKFFLKSFCKKIAPSKSILLS